MINGVHHIAINSPDMARLVAFYRDALGFEEVTSSRVRWTRSPEIDAITGMTDSAAEVVMMRGHNAYLEIFQIERPVARNDAPLRPSDHGYTHICLDVTDIGAEYERLLALGMTFVNPPVTVDGGRIKTAYGRDPDGNLVEIQELSEELDMSAANLRGF